MSVTATASSRGRQKIFWRYTLLTHRWLGIGVGIIVFLWCLSGIVMMYVQYPDLDTRERLAGMEPIDSTSCCRLPAGSPAASLRAGPYALESLSGRPLLRMATEVVDVTGGRRIAAWPDDDLREAGIDHARRRGWTPPDDPVLIERDQWTVHARFDTHRPLLKFANAKGRNWYVSSTTAEVIQVTSRPERFWNWLGAVPHWLYPTILRQHTALWAQVVIWLTIVSLFLTVTGLVIGIRQFQWRRRGRRSPYRGLMLWHHYAGVVFGLFTLTWVFSGLFSMNPWGLLDSRSFEAERQVLNGVDGTVADVLASLDSVLTKMPEGTVRVESAYWVGKPYWLALDARGNATRIGIDGSDHAIDFADVRRATAAMGAPDSRIDRIESEDAYYYGLHEDVALPAWRITTTNGERIYVDASTGIFAAGLDANGRRLRWLFEGLHRGDFHALLRSRPVWDVLMLALLAGVTTGAGSGVWIGVRRLRRQSGFSAQ